MRPLLLLLLAACSWAVEEPNIDDPLGLGKRLALLDYLQTVDHLAVPPGADYEQLCLIYWKQHPPVAPDIRAPVTAEDLRRDEEQRLRTRLKREYRREAPAGATIDDLKKALAVAEVEEREKARREVVTGDKTRTKGTVEELEAQVAGGTATGAAATGGDKAQPVVVEEQVKGK